MKELKDWHDIKEWAEQNGFRHLANRLQFNTGEFGRSQVAICDALRIAKTEEERLETAEFIEKELSEDLVDQIINDIDNEENYEKI